MVDHYGSNYRKELYYVEKGPGQPVIFIHRTVTELSHLTIPVGKIWEKMVSAGIKFLKIKTSHTFNIWEKYHGKKNNSIC